MIQSSVDRLILSIAGTKVGKDILKKDPKEFDDFEKEIASVETSKKIGTSDHVYFPQIDALTNTNIDFSKKDGESLNFDASRADEALVKAAREVGAKTMLKNSFDTRLKNAKIRKNRMQSVGGVN